MTVRRQVEFRQVVSVEVDESKFTPEFMQQFRDDFYQFHTLDQHIVHLGTLKARGMDGDFIEGYGKVEEFGIKFDHISDSARLLDKSEEE